MNEEGKKMNEIRVSKFEVCFKWVLAAIEVYIVWRLLMYAAGGLGKDGAVLITAFWDLVILGWCCFAGVSYAVSAVGRAIAATSQYLFQKPILFPGWVWDVVWEFSVTLGSVVLIVSNVAVICHTHTVSFGKVILIALAIVALLMAVSDAVRIIKKHKKVKEKERPV